MIAEKFIIIFAGEVGFITPDNALTLTQLDIASIAGKIKEGVYWEITVKNYNFNNHSITAQLDRCYFGDAEFPEQQLKYKQHLDEIKKISFPKLNTPMILPGIGSFPYQVHSTTITDEALIDGSQITEPKTQSQKSFIPINEVFPFRIKNLNFRNGYVSFEKSFAQTPRKLDIIIKNEFLKEEFDAVKNYFAQVLQTKKITVLLNIHLKDDYGPFEAISPQIDLINEHTIENVRLEYVRAIISKRQKVDSDKPLLTMEEFFDEDASEEWKAFYQNENELAEDLMKITNTKHYKNLRLLSSRHDSENMKLRFVINPFSFIFLVSGQQKLHFVWETLDTEEATYIWHFGKEDKNLDTILKQVEQNILEIKTHGKRKYIDTSKHDYSRVYHDYSLDVEGFLKWKDDLEAFVS